MANSIIKWAEIENFHATRRTLTKYTHMLMGNNVVTYKGKVKLHGTNGGVQCFKNGDVVAQSRSAILTATADNAGFAKWVEQRREYFQKIAINLGEDVCIFGEYAGPGIQKGVAITQIPNKIFAVFAAQTMKDENSEFIVKPEKLQQIIGTIPDVYVLPWHENSEVSIDYSKPGDSEELKTVVEQINKLIEQVETCDPWVSKMFNVNGVGEGLVFYPLSSEHLGRESFKNLGFKAKGEEHRVVRTNKAVQLEVPKVDQKNVEAFVNLVLTDARLEQGATIAKTEANSLLDYDKRLLGKFLSWVERDVTKEAKPELEASELTFEQIKKSLLNKARLWYIDHC
jgi:hypothetical protein